MRFIYIVACLAALSACIRNAHALPPCPPTTWTNEGQLPGAPGISAVTFAQGIYLGVGSDETVMSSADGVTWADAITVPQTVDYLDVAFGNGAFVAVGSNGRVDVLTGPNPMAQSLGSSIVFAAAAFGEGRWVVVGGYFTVQAGWHELIVYSSNGGTSWTVALDQSVGSALQPFRDVVYSAGRFIAVSGDGDVRLSEDGISWSSPQTIAPSLQCIASGNGVLIAAGNSGLIRRSTTNGTSWTNASLGTKNWFDIAFGDGAFVLVGEAGAMGKSLNGGVSWSPITSPSTENIECVAFGTPSWVAMTTSPSGQSSLLVATCPDDLDLQPYQPAGWSGPVVVSNETGTTLTSPRISEGETLFIDAAWANFGTDACGAFTVTVSVDGVVLFAVASDGLPASSFQTVSDLAIGTLAAGEHSVKIKIDADGSIAETNEANNEATLVVVVTSMCPPDLTADGIVDSADLAVLLGAWGGSGVDADLNADNIVDALDLSVLLGNWGACQ